MSDLPRFYQGAQGRLDFATLNEAFTRLDALRPLIESASVSSGFGLDLKPRVFPVFASETSGGRYYWQEIVLREDDTPVLATDDDIDEVLERAQFREGGVIPEGESEPGDDYAVLLDSTVQFEFGFCLCIASRRVDGSNRYVLVPAGGGSAVSTASIFYTESAVGEISIDLPDRSVQAFEYTGSLYAKTDDGWSNPVASTLYDFSKNMRNDPVGSGAQFFYHPWDEGTIVTPHRVGSLCYYGTLPRLDFECPG